MSLIDPDAAAFAWPASPHGEGWCDSTRCGECQQDEAVCEDCGDVPEAGTGCRHDGHVWCASCFLDHCLECADNARDDLANGDYERGL